MKNLKKVPVIQACWVQRRTTACLAMELLERRADQWLWWRSVYRPSSVHLLKGQFEIKLGQEFKNSIADWPVHMKPICGYHKHAH